ELMSRYFARQATAVEDGLSDPFVEGEVLPYEASPVQSVDARLAWNEAQRVLTFYHPTVEASCIPAPPHWAQLVVAQEPILAVAFCAGNYPQLVRNFQPLLQAGRLAQSLPAVSRPVSAPALVDWAAEVAANNQFPHTLLALGGLRLARQFDH